MHRCLSIIVLASAGCVGDAPPPTPVAAPAAQAASTPPVLRLPRAFVPTAYSAQLALDPSQTTFDGSMSIHGNVAEPTSLLWLHGRHLAVHLAEARPEGGGRAVPLAIVTHADLLEVRASSPLSPGAWVLHFDYRGEVDELDTSGAFKQTVDGKTYLYTQFEAVYARRVFPCVDEPDSKVPWQLTLDVPAGMTAVSNTRLAGTTALPGGRTRFEFERSKPLSSYLVAFGVGPFDLVEGPPTRSNVPVRLVTLAGRSADAAYSVATTTPLLDLLEDWFGIPYPYDKLDLLTIPVTAGFGAMENAGLITFAENFNLFEQKTPSWEKRHLWVAVAAHELAHQWFGNYVTPVWWDDIWLNEGFATWMESKIATSFEPTWHDELGDLDLAHKALDADRLASARQIREPVRTPDDILNAFDDITYEKGATVLNMFERYVGSEVFQLGVRQYLKSRANGNATSDDFLAAISQAAGKDLAPAFATFLEQKGAPELGAELVCPGAGAPTLLLSQQPFSWPGAPQARDDRRRWLLPVCVAYDRQGARAETCTLLDDGAASVQLDTTVCPSWVMANVDGRGYYRRRYDTAQLRLLRDIAWPKLTWTERRNVFFDVTEALRWGGPSSLTESPASDRELGLALSLLPLMLVKGNRFTIDDAVEFAKSLDRFVPDDLRAAYEAWLRGVFSPTASALGLMPRAGDDLDAEVSRVHLLEAAAFLGRDPALVREARQRAEHWRDLPQAIRGTVLTLAVDSDPALGSSIATAVETEPDRARRAEMLAALAGVRDPERVTVALKLTSSPLLDLRESMWVLDGASTERTRRVKASFFRANEATLIPRLPKDEVAAGTVRLGRLFTRSCDAAEREETGHYLREKFASMPGGKVTVEQMLEEMDQCIAARARIEPQLRAWLGGSHSAKHERLSSSRSR